MFHRESQNLARMLVSAAVWLLLFGHSLRAEVVFLEIQRREPFAGGKAFGDTGAYEKIVGIARFAVDPAHPRNQGIVDLGLAPRNAQGKVEFEADFYILAPKDLARGNGAMLYDVNNRGLKLALRFFNDAQRNNEPATVADAGNGFLFRRGYTVVWCGWNGEVLAGGGNLLLRAPAASEQGKPVVGLIRQEMVADAPTETMPLSRREGHGSYAPTMKGEREATLTWRMREADERVPIPRGQWSLARNPIPTVKQGVPGTLGQVCLKLSGGFRPGYIYELLYEAESPIVQGLGFAAVRDLVSFLRYEAGEKNPLQSAGTPACHRAHGFGVSQSGRFLRQFLYLGMNVDEGGRKVFDGLMPLVAGAGASGFNHRFAQPNRYSAQHEDHLYPTDIFPFAYGETEHTYLSQGAERSLEQRDGLLRRTESASPKFLPKVMHVNSAAEYWHRGGSLVHTDPLGKKDLDIPDSVRIYAFGGTQHGPAGDPAGRDFAENPPNPADYRPFVRALLDALDDWVREGKAPPLSVFPRIDQGTLVDWRQSSTGFPSLPGVRYPEVIETPPLVDFGPDFKTKGVIAEPPKPMGLYVVRVPKSGPDGNDLGTLLLPEAAVPLATYTGWNLRRRSVGAEGMLASLLGSYFPFPKTKTDRAASGDPRLSIEERYGSFEEYKKSFAAACNDLVKRRYLLQEDAERLLADREKVRDRFAEWKGRGR